MIKLTINNIEVEVTEGTNVLLAAEKTGAIIPTMCFLKGMSNHPSCMLCIVKDVKSGNLHPSCALPASEGMEIITDDDEIHSARKEALELLLSDHVGDCEAPCRPSCPANMNIPLMNRLIAEERYQEALDVVKEEIALPLILGYICPAPCEKACRRKQVDEAVSICSLKKQVAYIDIENGSKASTQKAETTGKKVAIIGSGPAGLSCTYYLLLKGHSCAIIDKNSNPGGSLRYQIPDDKLPKDALDAEIEILKDLGAEFIPDTHVDADYFKSVILVQYDAVVIAMGNFTDTNVGNFGYQNGKYGLMVDKSTYEVNQSGIFACGNVIRSRRMAVTSVAQGKTTAESVHQFLSGVKPVSKKRIFNSKFGSLKEGETHEYQKEAIIDNRVILPNGKLDNLTDKQAIVEAKRCMHCDCRKPSSCKLRIYANEYKADQKKYKFGDRKLIKKYFQHEAIVYEPEKCIKCNLCVDICAQKQNEIGFTSIGRGFDLEINMPLSHSINEIFSNLAIDCAKHCPTGAISLK
jgi:glutamate synthase (NADPH) small chain